LQRGFVLVSKISRVGTHRPDGGLHRMDRSTESAPKGSGAVDLSLRLSRSLRTPQSRIAAGAMAQAPSWKGAEPSRRTKSGAGPVWTEGRGNCATDRERRAGNGRPLARWRTGALSGENREKGRDRTAENREQRTERGIAVKRKSASK
jgi:hypothetical protein